MIPHFYFIKASVHFKIFLFCGVLDKPQPMECCLEMLGIYEFMCYKQVNKAFVDFPVMTVILQIKQTQISWIAPWHGV